MFANVLIVPALDLLGGKVVRLHQGDFEQAKSYSTDLMRLVERYAEAGARRLHVVDLDAAGGSGDNRALVEQIVARAGLQVQVGGGIRGEDELDRERSPFSSPSAWRS
jgi:phosphoribosylformimino-5-aminoimidazole carboxamide ribotide isomerase